jgi:flagellar hook-associated protein 1 FlgK
MGSTFSGIELGKRGLNAHSQSLHTAGHNLTNASTEGYSRQRVKLGTMDPLYAPQLNREHVPGQIGQGVQVESVERVRDDLLQGRIVSQGDDLSYWKTRDHYVLMVEQVYNEPDDTSVRKLMDNFWVGWQELSAHPEEMASRASVLRNGEALIDGINERYTRLKEVSTLINDDIIVSVTEVNGMLSEIAELNLQIQKSKALGDNPNDLLDRRDLLVEQVSQYVDITVDNRDPDEFQIHTGGRHLVQGDQVFFIDAVPNQNNEGYVDIVWRDTGEITGFKTGKLGSLTELRDVDVRGEIQKLDLMTQNFTDMVNDVHRQAFGLNGRTGTDFFVEQPFVNNLSGNFDLNGDGDYDSSMIFRISGTNALDLKDQIGIEGTIILSGRDGDVQINYNPNDTVEEVIKKINSSGAEVFATQDHQGHLVLKATPSSSLDNPDFVIRHVEDSGQFLAGYAGILAGPGAAGAYDWQQADAVLTLREGGVGFSVAPQAHPAGWLTVNPALVTDPATIASSFGENGRPGEIGDGSAALSIADLRNKPVVLGPMGTFDDFFAHSIADIGLKGQIAQQSRETQELVMKDLKDFQSSISGVNMDEEMADIIRFQHGYSATARFISEVDKMLDTIINRLGV